MGNALQAFLHAAATGQIDPFGEFSRGWAHGMDRRAEQERQNALLKERQRQFNAMLPVHQGELGAKESQAATSAGRLDLDRQKEGQVDSRATTKFGRDAAMGLIRSPEMDPQSLGGQLTDQGVDVNKIGPQLGALQKASTARAVQKSGQQQAARTKVQEDAWNRKFAKTQAAANDPSVVRPADRRTAMIQLEALSRAKAQLQQNREKARFDGNMGLVRTIDEALKGLPEREMRIRQFIGMSPGGNLDVPTAFQVPGNSGQTGAVAGEETEDEAIERLIRGQ